MARPRPGEGNRPDTPAWVRPRRIRTFDLLGIVAVAAFVAVVLVDRAALTRPRDEISLHLDPAELAAGFREGVEFHGLYRDDVKVGFVRLARRRSADGYRLTHTTVLEVGLGDGPTRLTVDTDLDDRFRLRGFSAVATGPVRVRAAGTWTGDALAVDLDGPLGTRSQRLPMDEPPAFDFSLAPLAARSDLAVGDRFRFTHFDPMTMATAEGTVQMLGRDPVDVLGERVEAIHLRQELSGQTLDLWINELGEVLREQLPTGLVAVRESEAEATWGFVGATSPEDGP